MPSHLHADHSAAQPPQRGVLDALITQTRRLRGGGSVGGALAELAEVTVEIVEVVDREIAQRALPARPRIGLGFLVRARGVTAHGVDAAAQAARLRDQGVQ
ncbi:hypothetical protein KDA82_22140, partial [Streptomyces daliensis]|nr:hypothetical protein [Streptomyces daliensis]